MNTALAEVAVVDDDREARVMIERWVKKSGFQPKVIQGHFGNVSDLVEAVSSSNFVVCDHKLSYGNFANFPGVEAVAKLYEVGKPAILVTQYTEPEKDHIHRFREKVPFVVPRDEMRQTNLAELFSAFEAELQGHPSITRKKHRVFVRIDEVAPKEHPDDVIAFIPAWRNGRAVSFSLNLLPPNLPKSLQKGDLLIAEANIGATIPEELFVANFEIAPDPVSEEQLEKMLSA